MRAVVQRVDRAQVGVNGKITASIGRGLLVLAGVQTGDTDSDITYIVRKCLNLRVFEDEQGVMNRSASDLDLEILLVSQFTLLGDVRKGNRPSYIRAGNPEDARMTFEQLAEAMKAACPKVQTGSFRAHMDVELVNDGPVTILLDSRKAF